MRILKSLILGIFFLFCGASINPAQSAQVANVEYIHKLVNQRWGGARSPLLSRKRKTGC